LLPLPEDVTVYPGHDNTTIGIKRERRRLRLKQHAAISR
jgi:glyoxylase-like metal-dependent hydrolase (beta-lactamase superfamily II)